MSEVSVWLVEAGFPDGFPGVQQDYPAASFPFWGNYFLLDFALANFAALPSSGLSVVADLRQRSLEALASSRWESGLFQLQFLDEGLKQFIQLLKASPADRVLLASLSFLGDIDSEALLALCLNLTENLVKIAVGRVPVDIYLAKRKYLIRILESFLHRGGVQKQFTRALFAEVLHHSFELIQEAPGLILFQNSLRQFYQEHLKLAGGGNGSERARLISRLKGIRLPEKETFIEGSAFIKNSFIASGARVAGYVEGSVIFSDVTVAPGARVVDSVVMNGNRIGARALIYNSLIFPYTADHSRGANNIGEAAAIGSKRSSAVNDLYPEQIRDGLTVLGTNAEIPGGATVEAGCLVGPDVPSQRLRALKQIKKGSSVLWNTGR